MKIVIEEVKNAKNEIIEIKIDSEGDVSNEFIFSSAIALIEALSKERKVPKNKIISFLIKNMDEVTETESGEPINEVKSSID